MHGAFPGDVREPDERRHVPACEHPVAGLVDRQNESGASDRLGDPVMQNGRYAVAVVVFRGRRNFSGSRIVTKPFNGRQIGQVMPNGRLGLGCLHVLTRKKRLVDYNADKTQCKRKTVNSGG